MYKNARIRLTVSYLLIVAFISILLSSIIYLTINQVTLESLKKEEKRIERNIIKNSQIPSPVSIKFSDEAITEVKNRNLSNLVLFNLLILGITGFAGYWVAGQTLKPIEENEIKQKQFISNAAHELKTPITASITSMEVTLRDPNLNLEESKKILKSVIEDLKSLNILVLSLLRFQKTQEIQDKKEISDLEKILDKVIITFKPIILQKKLIFNKNLEIKQILVFPNLFKELLLVLIDNAIKFSKSYGEINISSKLVEENIEIDIYDQGLGIPSEKISFIFDRFYKADSSRNKESDNGFGLGLSIAKEIVEKHKGIIECYSEEGKFTLFKIKIPNK